MREPGKIETAPTPVTEKQDYTHGDVRNVIMRLQLTNVLKAIKLNPIHIRVISTSLLIFNSLYKWKWNQQLIDVITRSRNVIKRESKAASLSAIGTNNAQLIHNLINGKH